MFLWPELQSAAFNLAVALFCGAMIGTERQARQRTAGLRTNALVALGAAAFVIFAARFTGEASPTRVAAQVVSGIGFLGAGIIYREGLTVHGLNTAATLWCSAAVGLMAGTSAWHLALLLTAFVMFVNLGLRPLVKWIKQKTQSETRSRREYHLWVKCAAVHETESRRQLLQAFGYPEFHIISISSSSADGNSIVTVEVVVEGRVSHAVMVEQLIHRLALDPVNIEVKWQGNDEA